MADRQLELDQHASWLGRAIGGVEAATLVLGVWLLVKPGSSTLFLAGDNIVQCAGPLVAATLCMVTLRRGKLLAGQRRSPVLLALGTLCYALGQGLYTFYEQVLHVTPPFPSWADALYLGAYPFMLVGILLLPGRRLMPQARLRVLLDSIMIMTAGVTFSWYLILGPTLAQSTGTWASTVVGLAYPLGDLVLIACLVLLGMRITEPALRRVVTVLVCALSVIILTDSIYDYQTLHGGYATGGLLDMGWPAGYMLLAVGSAALARVLATPAVAETDQAAGAPAQSQHLLPSLLPSALVPLVGVLLVYSHFNDPNGQYDLGVSVGAVVLVAVIVLRQVTTILENRRLYAQLDRAYTAQGHTLAERDAQMRTVVAHAPIVLWAVDAAGISTLYEGQGLVALGHRAGQFVGRPAHEVFKGDQRVLTAVDRALAGEATTLELRVGTLVFETTWMPLRSPEGTITGAIAVAHDITERTRAEAELHHQAFHDVLTGLPNRALFLDRLQHAATRSNRLGASVGVLFLDLDRFKLINDSLGHAAGDHLLVAVAERLKSCLRASDTVARFGGDEFAVLLGDLQEPQEALISAERILAVLDAPFHLDGHDVVTATSIGIVIGMHEQNAADLLRDADVALYRAKAKGRGRFEVFDETMNAQAMERLELEADLRGALEHDEFEVYYQPKIELTTGALHGMEALIRWRHPRRGLVSPVAFIPLCEETGLIRPLGQWVLEEACRQTRRWHEEWPGLTLTTSINLSSRQFQHPTLVEDVARALADSGVAPRYIQLEITESVAMDDAEVAVATLTRLKALGVSLAIDDFGTGYSSLSYLKRLPVDVLKIDRAFVSGMLEGSEDASIVHAVTSLGHALGLSVVAEGIETSEESRHVHTLGCEVGQGYYFAKPLTSADADAFIAHAVLLVTADGAA